MAQQWIKVADLRLGMYVRSPDCPWTDLPFLFQGFILERPEDLITLRTHCSEVAVDPDRSLVRPSPAVVLRRVLGERERPLRDPPSLLTRGSVRAAARVRRRARENIDRLFSEVRMGRSVSTPDAQAVVVELVEHITRDAEASLWLTNLRERDEYTSVHCLNVCVLTLAFCHQLGFQREELHAIGIGALLHDVGKLYTPDAILTKDGPLTDIEFDIVKRHPSDGYELMRGTGGMPEAALEVIRWHHERLGGQGYPDGLIGGQIPVAALAVGIADAYDAMTSERPYSSGVAPEVALGRLYEEAEGGFGLALTTAFIRCVGIYPVGTLVRLETGAVGLVAAAHPDHRLEPTVLLLRSPSGEVYQDRRLVDLMDPQADTRIERVISGDEAGVDLAAVLEREVGLVDGVLGRAVSETGARDPDDAQDPDQ